MTLKSLIETLAALRVENEALKAERGDWCPDCDGLLQKPPEEREKLYELFNLLSAPAGSAGAEGQVTDALLYLRDPVAETDSLVAENETLGQWNREAKAVVERAAQLAEWMLRDRREPDKVAAYAQELVLLTEPKGSGAPDDSEVPNV